MEKLSGISIPNGYVKTMGAYYEYRSTKEGNRMLELLEHLNDMAIEFCELHDVTCCFTKTINTLPINVSTTVIL